MPSGMASTMNPWFSGSGGLANGSQYANIPGSTNTSNRRRSSGGHTDVNPQGLLYQALAGLTGSMGGGGGSGVPEPTFEALPNIDVPTVGESSSYYHAPEMQANMERLIQEAAGIAPQQITAGRALEAQQLNEAAKRISRTGSSIGANKFARNATWGRMASQLGAERGAREADLLERGQGMQASAVGALTGAQATARDQALTERAQQVALRNAAQEALLQRAGLDISQQSVLSQNRLGSGSLALEQQRNMLAAYNSLASLAGGAGGSSGGGRGGFSIEGGGGGGGSSSSRTSSTPSASSSQGYYSMGEGWLPNRSSSRYSSSARDMTQPGVYDSQSEAASRNWIGASDSEQDRNYWV